MIDNNALFKISYGLYVLTAKENDFDNGCMTNTVIQQTAQPLTVSVTVNKLNRTHDMIKNTGVFNVSCLTVETPFEVVRNFGFQSGSTVDKFRDFKDCRRTENGLYAITGCSNAFISGKVKESFDLGTHTMFLADVTESGVMSAAESLTYGYYHLHVKPKPESKPQGKTVWRCKICGYIYEGDPIPADFICPICKHGAVDFERIVNG